MCFADFAQFRKHGVGLALFFKFGNGGQGQVDVVVNQFLATGNGRQIQNRIHHGVQTAEVGDQSGRIQLAGAHHGNGLFHIVGVATGSAHHMGIQIVDIVPVEGGFELTVGRTGKEVQATVESQNIAGLLNQRSDGSEANYIVIAGVTG